MRSIVRYGKRECYISKEYMDSGRDYEPDSAAVDE
jgi:hypothetical protein